MPQSLSNLIMHLKPYWLTSAAAVVPLVLVEGPGIDIIGSQIGLGGDTILLYNSDGTPVEEFAATGAGFNLAIAAAVSGNIILLPAMSITLVGTPTIPSGVLVAGMVRLGSILIGDIVVDVGMLYNCYVQGHITIQGNGSAQYVSAASDSGNIITVTHGAVLNCEIDMVSGAAYGVYATTGTGRSSILYTRTYRRGNTGTAVGCYLNGAQVRVAFCKFGGAVGGVVEATELVSNCYFLGDTDDGMQHTTGTSYITHSTFWSTTGGVGADIDAAINLGNVSWNSVTGDNFITWIPPDDGSIPGYGGGSGNTIWAETGVQVELDGPLAVSNDTGGLLEGFKLIGENEATNPVIACGAGGASDNFIREPGNVLYEPNETTRKYKTTYTGYSGTYEGVGANEKIHYAYSEDGKTWTKYASNPVIAVRAEDPYLVKVNNTYYLYVEDKQNQGAGGLIRRYHSADCITWTDDGQITGFTNCQSPTVWREGATWYMLYENWPNAPLDTRLATSTDGLAWTAEASNPVFSSGDTAWAATTVVPDDIFKVGTTYYMSYHGDDGGGVFHQAMAKSTNLTAWTDLGQITEDTGDNILHAQVFYDTRFVFLYWNVETVADTYGIYRGYPLAPILTEASDAITVNGDRYYVAAQTGTSDDLATINGGVYGQFLMLQADTGDTITIKHNTGNIWINNLADAALTGNNSILLFWDGTKWSTDGIQAAASLALNDLTDVDTTGVGTGDIIYKTAGDWEDYPLGIGTNIENDGSTIKIGDVTGGNYLSIDLTSGEIGLNGDATVFEDIRVEPVVRQAAGAGVPSFEKYFDDAPGTSKGVYLLSFTDEAVAGNEKEVFFNMQMPHSWKIGSDIHMHVHFVPSATVNSSDIIWGLEYCWKSIGEIYGDTVIIQSSTTLLPDDANITAGKHYLAEFADISPGVSASSLSSILIGRLFRNSSDAGDTYTNKVGLLYIDAHYEVDSLGSTEEYEKTVLLADSDGETLLDSDGVELTE